MSSPSTDWVQFYQLNLGGQASPATNTLAADATIVTTSITSSTTPANSTTGAQLSPEGRVSKPARRRRASRAAPTTLLNTDTANFRAMVQQFTGVPSAPSPFMFGTAQVSGPNLSFGLAPQSRISGPVPVPPSNYYSTNRYHHQQQQLTQQQQYYNQQQQQYQHVFPFSNSTSSGDGFQSSSDGLIRPNMMEVSTEGFVMEGGSSASHHQLFPGSSSSNGNNRSSSGYNL